MVSQNDILNKILVIGIISLFFGIAFQTCIASSKEGNSPISSGKFLYVGGSGPGNYTKIQDAINNASDGDTVYVYNGIYLENIIIEKSINLFGEDKETTIIFDNFSHTSSTVTINKLNATIKNFTIIGQATSWGIEIQSDYSNVFNSNISGRLEGVVIESDHNTIVNNYVKGNKYWGISLSGNRPSFNFIFNNTIIGKSHGIRMHESYNNIIKNNTIYGEYGITLYWSNKNIISNNRMNKGGITLGPLYDNTVTNNYVNNRSILYLYNESDSIYNQDFGQIILNNCDNITIENQDIYDVIIGIYLIKSNNCIIRNNNISYYTIERGIGIKEISCDSSTIFNNSISNYTHGINTEFSNKSLISNNDIQNCGTGVHLSNCDKYKIFKNNFIKKYVCIDFSYGTRNSIVTMNNFIGNRPYVSFFDPKFAKNIYFGNYWGRSRLLPKLIFGAIVINDYYYYPQFRFWFKIDLHPALKPYDIEL
jgi:parallel beta-helix repeat protein